MEGSNNKGVSPLKSRKSAPNHKPSSTGESNENDSSHNQMNLNLQNPKKVVVKNFMSPTISAASKAAVPRNKILVDRNENSSSSDAQFQDNFNHDPKRIHRRSRSHSDRSATRVVSSYNQAYQSDDDTDSLANSSSKPYDPLTNYLTPRPKFLRFNPSRRHEILTRLQIEGKEELNGSFESQKSDDEEESSTEDDGNSSFYPMIKSVGEQQNEGNVEKEDQDTNDGSEEETDEEEEEEELEGASGWCLRGVIKILFTVIACLLSISYICNMNSPTPSPIEQAIWDLKDGYLMIQKQTLEVIAAKMHETGFVVPEEGDSYHELDEVEIDENGDMDTEENIEVEMAEDHEVNLEGHKGELVQNENKDGADQIDKAEVTEILGAAEFKGEKFEQSMDAIIDESRDTDGYEVEKEVEIYNQGYNEVVGGSEVESETNSFQQLIGAPTDESDNAGNSEFEKETDDSNQLQELELPLKSNSAEESKELDGVESPEELIGSHEKSTAPVHEVDEIGYDNEGQMPKSGWNTFVIGVSLVSISLASLAAFFYRSKKAMSKSAGQSQSVLKPHRLNLEEKVTSEAPALGNKNASSSTPEELNQSAGQSQSALKPHRLNLEEKVTSEAPALGNKNASSSKPLSTPEELNHRDIRVPTAELIGEIVIGETTNSARIYGRRNQMVEFEESSVAILANQGSPPQPVSTPNQPSTQKFSYTTTSDSLGSFTAERNISKIEGSSSAKAMAEVATPLRRSSRLRNRGAVMSP